MLNKILISSFAALLIVVLIEGALLLFGKPSNNQLSRSKPVVPVNAVNERETALLLMNLIFYGSRGALTEATVNLKYNGSISELYTKPGRVVGDDYEIGMRIKGANGQNYLLFSKNDLNYMEISARYLIIDWPIKFTNLKVGDKIKVELESDLTQPNQTNTQRIKIIKL